MDQRLEMRLLTTLESARGDFQLFLWQFRLEADCVGARLLLLLTIVGNNCVAPK